MSTSTETDIMTLVDYVVKTRDALQRAIEARDIARDVYNKANKVVDVASIDYELAQNALVVAAGGVDRSWKFLPYTPNDADQ